MINFATNNNDVSNWTIQKAKIATISEKEIMIVALRDKVVISYDLLFTC